jgi:hypothetical protein
MTDGDVGFGYTVDAVLWTEKFNEFHARGAGEHVGRTLTVAVNAGPVRHEAAAQALEAAKAFGREDIDAKHDFAGDGRGWSWRDR